MTRSARVRRIVHRVLARTVPPSKHQYRWPCASDAPCQLLKSSISPTVSQLGTLASPDHPLTIQRCYYSPSDGRTSPEEDAAMNAELRVVHYLNQFFGGIGGRLPGAGALPHAQGVARGFLRLAGAPAGAARAGGRTAGSRDRRDPRGDAATLREPPDSRGAGGARVPDRSQARGAAHAGSRAGRTAPPPVSGHDAGANRKRWQLNPGVYETGASPDGRSPSFSRDRRTGPGIVPFYQRRRPTILGVVPLLGSPRRWFYRR